MSKGLYGAWRHRRGEWLRRHRARGARWCRASGGFRWCTGRRCRRRACRRSW